MDRYTIVKKKKEIVKTKDIFISNDYKKLIKYKKEYKDNYLEKYENDYIDDYIEKYENEYIYNIPNSKKKNNPEFIYFAILVIMFYNL